MSAKYVFAGIGLFAAGVGVGVAGTLLYQQYAWAEQDEDEEPEEEAEEEEEQEEADEEPRVIATEEKPSRSLLQKKLEKESEEERTDYRQYHEKAAKYKPAPEPEEDDSEPMLITRDEYETIPGYSSEQLYLYSNGIVADVDDCPIRNPGALLGSEFMNYFEDGEEVAYIRNPRNHTEYELELVKFPFSEVGDDGGRG